MKSILLMLFASLVLTAPETFNINSMSESNTTKPIVSSSSSATAKKKVVVVFSRKLEFNDLVKLKLDMSDKGITLQYRKLVFDDFGKLSEIAFGVDCNDGFSGSAGDKLTAEPLGFYRDYENKETPFGVGDLKKHLKDSK